MQLSEIYQLYLKHAQVQTDTRKILPGHIFFALKGPNYNGNHYLQQAFDAGASWCITDEAPAFEHENIIQVSNTLQCLQDLAGMHRDHFDIPVIAITGSNGKTTTKELVHAVLSAKYKCHTTEGNLNNHIGIPLTLLGMAQTTEIAVIEMGANHLHEIEGYCRYTRPTHGIITNCGKAHLEGFGSTENVIKAKGELFNWLKEHEGTAFVNMDYDYLKPIAMGIKNKIGYGTMQGTYTAKILDDQQHLILEMGNGTAIKNIKTQLVGGYNLPNVLSAVAIGKYFTVSEDAIKQALEAYKPGNSRSQLIEKNGNSIILDAYNANPSSMKAAIENFAKMPGNNKILILGAMMELGVETEKEHAQIIELIQQYNWKNVVLTGKSYSNVPNTYLHFNDAEAVAEWIKAQHFSNVQMLIKGSRSMQMEKVLE